MGPACEASAVSNKIRQMKRIHTGQWNRAVMNSVESGSRCEVG